mmetsp:Transcript_33947/g.73196  ORF Transcript_33947/g.73196 Transcript_33947/m.73196 type:complete len:130 (+) Transcript_33947:719-1108(+)
MPTGGAATRVSPDATAFFFREDGFWVLIQAQWKDAMGTAAYDEARERRVQWCRETQDALRPFASSHYAVLAETSPHGLPETAGEFSKGFGIRNIYGDNLSRLRRIKARYDPLNILRKNDNIVPEETASH